MAALGEVHDLKVTDVAGLTALAVPEAHGGLGFGAVVVDSSDALARAVVRAAAARDETDVDAPVEPTIRD